MSDYTVKEIQEAFDAGWDDEKYGHCSNEWKEFDCLILRGEKVPVVEVESAGGMDMGTTAYVIFKVKDQFFQKDGWYQSHYGYEWDGQLYEVEPYEKTVTDYRKK
jgi:hypothetical protein